MKENGFTLKRQEADNILWKLWWILTMQMILNFLQIYQAEFLLLRIDGVVRSIGLYMNANKTEYMSYKQKMSHLHSKWLAFEISQPVHVPWQQLSSAESDVNIGLTKALKAIARLSFIWKFDLSDKIKRYFFQVVAVSILLYKSTTWTLTKWIGEKAGLELHKNVVCCLEQILEAAPHKTAALWSHAFYLTNHPSKISKICGVLLEKQ